MHAVHATVLMLYAPSPGQKPVARHFVVQHQPVQPTPLTDSMRSHHVLDVKTEGEPSMKRHRQPASLSRVRNQLGHWNSLAEQTVQVASTKRAARESATHEPKKKKKNKDKEVHKSSTR